MRKLILLLALLAGTLYGRSQGVGDLINYQFGFWGVERVKDILWHYGGSPGYYQIVTETQCIIDSAYWMPGKNGQAGGGLMKGDTLFSGRTYPFQIKKIKLKTGRAILYLNKGSGGTKFTIIPPTAYQVTVTGFVGNIAQ